jgi:hypothetical protein
MSIKISKPKLIIGTIVLVAGILFCVFLSIPSRRSGEELFKDIVLDPVPRSVIVLHSQDNETGFDGRLWLHFKISPDDLDLVLNSEKWEFDPEISYQISNYDAKTKDWWSPQSLGNNITQYSMLIKSDGDRKRIKYMWVNSQRNEVYLLYFDGFTH